MVAAVVVVVVVNDKWVYVVYNIPVAEGEDVLVVEEGDIPVAEEDDIPVAEEDDIPAYNTESAAYSVEQVQVHNEMECDAQSLKHNQASTR